MTWDLQGEHREVYLTFDDGPTPVITPWVLDRLDEAGARGTFFCLGRNVDKHPEIYRQIVTRGHSVGNHSYSHLKGFRSSIKRYMDDIHLASGMIDSKLFRPPYGRIFQFRTIRRSGPPERNPQCEARLHYCLSRFRQGSGQSLLCPATNS